MNLLPVLLIEYPSWSYEHAFALFSSYEEKCEKLIKEMEEKSKDKCLPLFSFLQHQ